MYIYILTSYLAKGAVHSPLHPSVIAPYLQTGSSSSSAYIRIHIYIYICIYIHMYMCVYMYIYTYKCVLISVQMFTDGTVKFIRLSLMFDKRENTFVLIRMSTKNVYVCK
jgi:hypothetical protein